QKSAVKKAMAKAEAAPVAAKKVKLSYKDQRALEQLPAEMEALEKSKPRSMHNWLMALYLSVIPIKPCNCLSVYQKLMNCYWKNWNVGKSWIILAMVKYSTSICSSICIRTYSFFISRIFSVRLHLIF